MLNLTSIEEIPNSAPEASGAPSVMIPSLEAVGIAETPAAMARAVKLNAHTAALARAMEPEDTLAKALAPPPSAFTFSTMSYMPDPQNGGLMAWPGIPPESLQKIARTNLAPEMIIATRIADVLRYSHRSSHPWKPGWRIELREQDKTPTTWDRRDIRACESMIENCNVELDSYHARQRDSARYPSFKKFLATIVREFLTYDAMAVYTDLDSRGRIKGWANLPAGNIRLADPTKGYLGNKAHFAVLVDQGGTVIRSFTRQELTWHVGNPRVEPDVGDYPLSRLDVGMRLVEGFQNSFDLNSDIFTKSSTPMGMLLLKGAGFTQNELDAIARNFQNLKKGISKVWALPAMVVPKDSEVEFLNLSASNDQDLRFQNYMNLIMGVFCLIYQFPHRRMGFHISGGMKDSEPLLDKNASAAPTDEEDIGLITLLGHLEFILNQYLIWTRFPHLQLVFSGKAPREDAREYEARQLARTWGERRAAADLPKLEELVEDEEEKKIARILSLIPSDAGMTSAFANLTVKLLGLDAPAGPGGGEGSQGGRGSGAPFPASRDPAKSEDKGATSGIRRHSPSKNPQRRASSA
jgi:hypothetical protein